MATDKVIFRMALPSTRRSWEVFVKNSGIIDASTSHIALPTTELPMERNNHIGSRAIRVYISVSKTLRAVNKRDTSSLGLDGGEYIWGKVRPQERLGNSVFVILAIS